VGIEPKIRWAPKVRTELLVRVYQQNARGLLDGDLVDEVGWRLWERLADVVRVTTGRVRCPVCGADFQVRRKGGRLDELRVCPGCAWSTSAVQWHRSWEHRDLNGNCPDFEAFVSAYPRAKTSRDRMILIDGVVHALHLSAKGEVSNFAARNFIEGSRPKIVALLEELAQGDGSAIAEGARRRWDEARQAYRGARPARAVIVERDVPPQRQ
jgi:hypothetical protein